MKFSTVFLSIACLVSSVTASCDKFRFRVGHSTHGELSGQYLKSYNGLATLDQGSTKLVAFFPSPTDTDGSELHATGAGTETGTGKFCLHPLAIDHSVQALLFESYDSIEARCAEWWIVNEAESSTLTYDNDRARFVAAPSTSGIAGYPWEIYWISNTTPTPAGAFKIDLIRECV